jgi:hypothetical protein
MPAPTRRQAWTPWMMSVPQLAKLGAQPAAFRTGSEIELNSTGSELGLTSAKPPTRSRDARQVGAESDQSSSSGS